METVYQQLKQRLQEASLLDSTSSVLGWDQETYMPTGGLNFRAKQMAQIAKLTHEMVTAPQIGEMLATIEDQSGLQNDPTGEMTTNVRQWRHTYDRETKLPVALVQAFATAQAQAKAAWQQARNDDQYEVFEPHLGELLNLLKEKAQAIGVSEGGEPWDALADGFEQGMTAASVESVFTPLRKDLVGLIGELMDNGNPPDAGFAEAEFPIDQQRAFVEAMAKQIGFDFNRGRLDLAAHPFCSGFHPTDVRLTTRFSKNNLPDALSSTMHEGGHGLYEQGLPTEHAGTPRGQAVSLSIHESQSRLWENQVGRSEAFWQWALPKLQDQFGERAAGFGLQDVYRGSNIVKPSLIRVESDEATYNLHIMIRFELERAMLKGDLSLKDLPAAWNDAYKSYLNVDVPSDTQGCLQDIHWSMGAMGYFPTYTMGNLYSAQLFDQAKIDLPGLEGGFSRGEFAPLLAWLREKVHAWGQAMTGPQLIEHVTGKPLSSKPLLNYLSTKLKGVYGMG